MKPIFHLSFPVRDMEEGIAFYREKFGATVGRHQDHFVDILMFGAQITLQNDKANVTNPMPRSRHFGFTLDWDVWEQLAERLADSDFVEPPKKSYVGEPVEQTKMMIRDPSGNLIELKAYRHPENVLGSLAAA